MAYIRSNEDYDRANGTWRPTGELIDSLKGDKHMPDSIRQEIVRDLKDRGVNVSMWGKRS